MINRDNQRKKETEVYDFPSDPWMMPQGVFIIQICGRVIISLLVICSYTYFGQILGLCSILCISIIFDTYVFYAVMIMYKWYTGTRRPWWLSKGCMYIRRNSELCCSMFLWLSNCFSISSTGSFLNQGLLRPLVIWGVESHTTGAEATGSGGLLEEQDKWRHSVGRQPEMPFEKSASHSRRWGRDFQGHTSPIPVSKLEGGKVCYFLLG